MSRVQGENKRQITTFVQLLSTYINERFTIIYLLLHPFI